MSSQHAHPNRAFRPDRREYDAAKAALCARGRGITAYLRACLRWLNTDPDAALAALAPVWPEPRQPGRPARADSPERPGVNQP